MKKMASEYLTTARSPPCDSASDRANLSDIVVTSFSTSAVMPASKPQNAAFSYDMQNHVRMSLE